MLIKPSYIPIFRLIQSAVYHVDISKDCSCFMIVTLRILYKFSPKLVRKLPLDALQVYQIQLDWSTSLQFTAIFFEV